MKVAVYRDHLSTTPVVEDTTWEELSQWLLARENCDTVENPCPGGKLCGNKNGLAWSPVDIIGTRKDENVKSNTALWFESDGLSAADLARIREAIKPYACILTSSHSHRPPDNRIHFVFQISREILPREYRTIWSAVNRHLDLKADESKKNPSALNYLARSPIGAPFIAEVNEGIPIDVDAFAKVEAPAVAVAPGTYSIQILRGAIRDRLANKKRDAKKEKDPQKKADALEHATLLECLLKGDPFAEEGERHQHIIRALRQVAWAVPDNTPWEAVYPIVAPSMMAMFTIEEIPKRIADARRAFEDDQERVRKAHAEKAAEEKAAEDTKAKAAAGESVGDNWRVLLIAGKNGDGYDACGANAEFFIKHHEAFGSVRFNEVTKFVEISGPRFSKVGLNHLSVAAMNWFQVEWGMRFTSSQIQEQINLVADANRYDPVKEYLESLVWDGTPRIDTWLIDYCAAKTTDEDGGDITEYVRMVGSRFLISAVARGLCPGEKVDTMLIFEGGQSLKKSTAAGVLGGTWFADSAIDVRTKDGMISAGSSWIIEMAELTSLRKSDVDSIKQFLSKLSDKFRPPYGRGDEVFPRRCVFIGTVNPDESGQYLNDPTGARRFWPVACKGLIDVIGLKKARDQLWAESVVRYRSFCAQRAAGVDPDIIPERWWFAYSERSLPDAQGKARTMDSTSHYIAAITAWWGTLQSKPEFVTVHKVAKEALGLQSVDQITHSSEIKIGKALTALNFTSARRWLGGERVTIYNAPKAVLKAVK